MGFLDWSITAKDVFLTQQCMYSDPISYFSVHSSMIYTFAVMYMSEEIKTVI